MAATGGSGAGRTGGAASAPASFCPSSKNEAKSAHAMKARSSGFSPGAVAGRGGGSGGTPVVLPAPHRSSALRARFIPRVVGSARAPAVWLLASTTRWAGGAGDAAAGGGNIGQADGGGGGGAAVDGRGGGSSMARGAALNGHGHV